MKFLLWYLGALVHVGLLGALDSLHSRGYWLVLASTVLWLIVGVGMLFSSVAEALKSVAVKAAANARREEQSDHE